MYQYVAQPLSSVVGFVTHFCAAISPTVRHMLLYLYVPPNTHTHTHTLILPLCISKHAYEEDARVSRIGVSAIQLTRASSSQCMYLITAVCTMTCSTGTKALSEHSRWPAAGAAAEAPRCPWRGSSSRRRTAKSHTAQPLLTTAEACAQILCACPHRTRACEHVDASLITVTCARQRMQLSLLLLLLMYVQLLEVRLYNS